MSFLALWIRISEILAWDGNSYPGCQVRTTLVELELALMVVKYLK